MSAFRQSEQPYETGPSPVGFDTAGRGWLDALRLVSMDCRCARRLDPTDVGACRMYPVGALVRCVGQILGRSPVIHTPGTAEVSFDEAWLLRLLLSVRDGDTDSRCFLIRSRVPRSRWYSLDSLIRQAARHL